MNFGVKNEGATVHGLAITPAPAAASGGMLEESAFVARGSDLAAGESETVSADLKPGSYELVCYLPATTRQVSGSRSRSSSDAGDARSGVARQCVA